MTRQSSLKPSSLLLQGLLCLVLAGSLTASFANESRDSSQSTAAKKVKFEKKEKSDKKPKAEKKTKAEKKSKSDKKDKGDKALPKTCSGLKNKIADEKDAQRYPTDVKKAAERDEFIDRMQRKYSRECK